MNGLVDETCIPCMFSARHENLKIPTSCDYYIITGERRPCPAGKGCTVRMLGEKKRKRVHLTGRDPKRKTVLFCPKCGTPVADRRKKRCVNCRAWLR